MITLEMQIMASEVQDTALLECQSGARPPFSSIAMEASRTDPWSFNYVESSRVPLTREQKIFNLNCAQGRTVDEGAATR